MALTFQSQYAASEAYRVIGSLCYLHQVSCEGFHCYLTQLWNDPVVWMSASWRVTGRSTTQLWNWPTMGMWIPVRITHGTHTSHRHQLRQVIAHIYKWWATTWHEYHKTPWKFIIFCHLVNVICECDIKSLVHEVGWIIRWAFLHWSRLSITD